MKPLISDMHQDLRTKFAEFSARMAEKGIPFGLSSVLRTRQEQEALYSQGRQNLSDVNALRILASMSVITDKENVIVTHTKNSRHFPDEGGKSRAFDIFIMRDDKKPSWDLKYDGNDDSVPDYWEAAEIGKSCGLVSGGLDFKKFKDWPHFELPSLRV